MPKVTVYDMTGKQVGDIELSDAIFGVTPNKSVMHSMVKYHLANLRQGTQSTLTRSEVRGGGRKPWRQKGTGRARQGSIRAPQWYHGGIALGPKPRSYGFSVNKKVKRLALHGALSSKVLSGDIIVVDNLQLDQIKTKSFLNFLNSVGVTGSALVVTPEANVNIIKSARNLPGVKTTVAHILSVYDVLNGKKLVVDRAAIARIEEVYA